MKKFFYCAIAVLMAVGCAQHDESDQILRLVVNVPETLYAEAEAPESRTYVENERSLRWTGGDEISYFPAVAFNMQYRYESESGSNNASFTKVTNDPVTGTALSCNYAVYPYAAGTAVSDEGIISLTLPAEQAYGVNSFGEGANTMVCATKNADDAVLRFKNVGGYLKIKLYGEDVTVQSITLQGNNNEKIAGAATVTVAYGADPEVTMANTATTTVTINCNEGTTLSTDAESPTAFWFVLPEVTFENGFTITVTDVNGGTFEKSTFNPFTIDRNMIQPMKSLEVKCTEVKYYDTESNPFTSDVQFISTAGAYSNLAGLGETTIYELPASGFKFGTSKNSGVFTSGEVGVEGDLFLNFYAVAWKDTTTTLYVRADGSEVGCFVLSGNDGATNVAPFNDLTPSYINHYSVKIPGLTKSSVIEFSTSPNFEIASSSSPARAILFGVKLRENPIDNPALFAYEDDPEVLDGWSEMICVGDGTFVMGRPKEDGGYQIFLGEAAEDAGAIVDLDANQNIREIYANNTIINFYDTDTTNPKISVILEDGSEETICIDSMNALKSTPMNIDPGQLAGGIGLCSNLATITADYSSLIYSLKDNSKITNNTKIGFAILGIELVAYHLIAIDNGLKACGAPGFGEDLSNFLNKTDNVFTVVDLALILCIKSPIEVIGLWATAQWLNAYSKYLEQYNKSIEAYYGNCKIEVADIQVDEINRSVEIDVTISGHEPWYNELQYGLLVETSLRPSFTESATMLNLIGNGTFTFLKTDLEEGEVYRCRPFIVDKSRAQLWKGFIGDMFGPLVRYGSIKTFTVPGLTTESIIGKWNCTGYSWEPNPMLQYFIFEEGGGLSQQFYYPSDGSTKNYGGSYNYDGNGSLTLFKTNGDIQSWRVVSLTDESMVIESLEDGFRYYFSR